MGPSGTPSYPAFPALDPIILDDEMESTFRNTDMDFLDPTKLETSSGPAGGDFDDLFARVSNSRLNAAPGSSKYQDQHPLRQPPLMAAESPAESPDNSSRSSSSESPRNHLRQASIASTNSAAHSDNPLPSAGLPTEDWMHPELSSVKEESPFTIDPSYPVDGVFTLNPDLESSNKAMDAAFDFESAASSPSPLKTENPPLSDSNQPSKSQTWSPSTTSAVPPPNGNTASVSHDGLRHGFLCRSLTCLCRLSPQDLRSFLLVESRNNPHSQELSAMAPRICLLLGGVDNLRLRFWKRVSEALT